jgi:hypothetical protein
MLVAHTSARSADLQVMPQWLDACFICVAKAAHRCGNVRSRREGCAMSKGSLTEAAVDASRAR